MLKSYSFMSEDVDISLYYEIWNEASKLRRYCYKFARDDTDEVLQSTVMHALTHFKPGKGKLQPYIKKLMREIAKGDGKLVFVDFLDETAVREDLSETGAGNVDLTATQTDFTDEVVDDIMADDYAVGKISCLALEYMGRFVLLCESLLDYSMSAKYFPEGFKSECLRIAESVPNFNDLCIRIYAEYADKFKWYTECADQRLVYTCLWREANFAYVWRRCIKSLYLRRTDNGVEVTDADVEECELCGVIQEGWRILQVHYFDAWEHMCNLAEQNGINELRFTLNGHYIIRTYAGSLSLIDPDMNSIYDLLRMEILTNVLMDTGGWLLNAGSENFYIVGNIDKDFQFPERDLLGYKLLLEYEDLTGVLYD